MKSNFYFKKILDFFKEKLIVLFLNNENQKSCFISSIILFCMLSFSKSFLKWLFFDNIYTDTVFIYNNNYYNFFEELFSNNLSSFNNFIRDIDFDYNNTKSIFCFFKKTFYYYNTNDFFYYSYSSKFMFKNHEHIYLYSKFIFNYNKY